MIYARISKDRAGAGLGVDRQLADCRDLAEREGWVVTAERTDNDLSAYSGKLRPGYRALLADIDHGRADAVIAWHTDRLHRRPLELEEYISVCERRNVPTVTVRSGPLDLATPSGRMIARQLGAVARYEVEHAIERGKRAKEQAAAAGRFRGGRRAFGYEADGVTVVDVEAEVVRECADRILVGESLSSLARELNSRNVTTSGGHAWSSTALRRVLLRPRNFARIELAGEVLEGVTAEWPAILDEDTGRAVRALLLDPRRLRAPKSADRVWLGAGLYLCGRCSDGTTVKSGGYISTGAPAYRCRLHGHLTRVAKPVDELVTAVVLRRLARPDARVLLRRETSEDPGSLHTQAVGLRARLDELAALFADGTLTASQLAVGTRRLRADLDRVETQLSAVATRDPLAGFADAADIGEAWGASSVARRKLVVGALMTVRLLPTRPGRQPGGGYFNPETVAIEWRR